MIGVLALQGGFRAHQAKLDQLGVAHREVRLPRDLEGLDGLILPGGESTTMLNLINAFGLKGPLQAVADSGLPILGTCAGAILMAETVALRKQESFGWIPVTIERNAYGTQQDSFQVSLDVPEWQLHDLPVLFIRAPRFVDLGQDVCVLSRWQGEVNGITYKQFTALTYHPELADDLRFHQAWLGSIARISGVSP